MSVLQGAKQEANGFHGTTFGQIGQMYQYHRIDFGSTTKQTTQQTTPLDDSKFNESNANKSGKSTIWEDLSPEERKEFCLDKFTMNENDGTFNIPIHEPPEEMVVDKKIFDQNKIFTNDPVKEFKVWKERCCAKLKEERKKEEDKNISDMKKRIESRSQPTKRIGESGENAP